METLIEQIAPNLYLYRDKFWKSCSATAEMFWKAGLIAGLIGLMLGILLVITKKDGIAPKPVAYQATNLIINVFRSVPFIILLIFLIPLTRAVVGTAINVRGAILPLVFGTVPFPEPFRVLLYHCRVRYARGKPSSTSLIMRWT